MRLVTDASPLIFLAKIELLPMLRSCFLQVLAPSAVVAETRLDLLCFIEMRLLRNLDVVRSKFPEFESRVEG